MTGVFISYRRTDGGGWAGRLNDHLSLRFGSNVVWQDVEDLEVGKDTIGEFRPVHFRDVRAMRFKNAVSGWANNPMTLLDGQGTYFEDYIIWPAEGNA